MVECEAPVNVSHGCHFLVFLGRSDARRLTKQLTALARLSARLPPSRPRGTLALAGRDHRKTFGNVLERWAPRLWNEPIALTVLLHMTVPRERSMKGLHQHLVGYQHVDGLDARLLRQIWDLIEECMPARIAYEQLGAVGYIGKHEHARRSRGNNEGGMAYRMAWRPHRRDAWRDLLAPFVLLQPLQDLPTEHAAVVLEQAFHAPLWGAAHLAVVHPEFVLR